MIVAVVIAIKAIVKIKAKKFRGFIRTCVPADSFNQNIDKAMPPPVTISSISTDNYFISYSICCKCKLNFG